MEFLEYKDFFLALVSGVGGIILGQASGYFDRRNQRRQALCRALAELLEIRHRLMGSMYLLRRMATELKIPCEALDECLSQLPDGILWDSGISERYNEAVSALSSHLPITAFSLRAKDSVRLFFNGVPIKFGPTNETHVASLKNMDLLEKSLLSTIEDSIEAVAGVIGRKTKQYALEIMSGTKEVNPDVAQVHDEVIRNMNAAIGG